MLKINEIYNLDCFDFLKKIDDKLINLAIIDPPYNLQKAKWDSFESEKDFFDFTFRWIDALIPKLKLNGSLYIFNTPYNSAFILSHLVAKGLLFQNWITWDKRDGLGGAKQKFSNGQESILFFTKGENHIFNYDDVRVPYESTDRIEHAKTKGILKDGKRWFPNPKGRLCGEVWHITSERHKNKINGKTPKMTHITPKPLELVERIIKASSNAGDLVLDCFVGSGTTAVVAKKLKRNFICSDLDKIYAKIAKNNLTRYDKNNTRVNTREILKEIISIQPDNQFLNYIVDRIQDGNYRGIHISQHNRYDLDRLTKILAGINEVVADKIFRVPPGDDKKGQKNSDCTEYYNIVESVKNVAGVGTINSLKKNFFVDFQKLGLLHRFDKNKNEIIKRSGIYYAQLTPLAIKLVDSSLVQQYKIFTDALDDLFADEITRLAETLYYSNYKDTPVGIIEFMLILSDDRPQMSDDKIDLINSYRALKPWQQKKVIGLIKGYCNPDNFRGDKTKKRDFGNWKNESQQIFSLLKNTVYFDITQNSLKLNTGMYGIFTDIQIKRRSLGAKQEYLQKHGIKKKIPTFELHHVIPFSAARNKIEFGLIDHWKNLVYLRNDKHAELTKSRDKNIVLYATEKELDFDDFNKKRIIARNGSTVVYAGNISVTMQKYNREILKEVFDFTI